MVGSNSRTGPAESTIQGWSRRPAGIHLRLVRALAEADLLVLADKTSHAVSLSSCCQGSGREGGGFVVGLSGLQAVVQAAEQAVEGVTQGGGMGVAGLASALVVGACAG